MEWAKKEYAKFSDDAFWLQELEIQYDAREGQRVYPSFDTAIHVVPDSEIPKRLTRYCSIDPHPRTPHAILWVGIDQWSDAYVYRELWPSKVYGVPKVLKDTDEEHEFTVRDYVETIAVLEGNYIEWHAPETDHEYGIYRRVKQGQRLPDGSIAEKSGENIVYRFMDQAGKAFRASGEGQAVETYARRYSRFGLDCSDPYKLHQAGEDAIRLWLKPRKHEIYGTWPILHVAASCKELILEFQRLRYPTLKRLNLEKELPQDGMEARRHLLDNLRYIATSEPTWIPSLAS